MPGSHRVLRSSSTNSCYQSVPPGYVPADVDGTLIRSVGDDANKLHKEAFSQAFKDVFDLDTHIDKLQHHGGTDPLILMKVLMVCHSIPKEKCMERLDDMKAAMTAFYEANKSRCCLRHTALLRHDTQSPPV